MSFFRYPKLSTKPGQVFSSLKASIDNNVLPDGVVFEVAPLIRGRHVSILLERNQSVHLCDRNGVLEAGKTVFGAERWLPQICNWKQLLTSYPNASCIQVFGCLCGGQEGGKQLCDDIDYGAPVSFVVFDIAITTKRQTRFLVPGDMRCVMHHLIKNRKQPLMIVSSPRFRAPIEKAFKWALVHRNDSIAEVFGDASLSSKPNEGWLLRPACLVEDSGSGIDNHMYEPLMLKVKSDIYRTDDGLKPESKQSVHHSAVKSIVETYATEDLCKSVVEKVSEHQRNVKFVKILSGMMMLEVQDAMIADCVDMASVPERILRDVVHSVMYNFLKI